MGLRLCESEYWADFYTKFFNFQEIRYFDINGEYTGLASKAMSAPDGLIRIPLNEEARQGGGQIEEFLMQFSGEGIQHIALLCDNLLDALDRVQMAGIPLLTAPNDIYYANLEKRLPGHGQPVPELQARGATVRAFDPEAMEAAAPMLPGAIFCRDAYHALDGADVAIVLTEWDDFADLDLGRAAERMRRRLMVDFRNLYRPGDVTAAGIDYVSLGRPAASAERHRRAVSSVDADEAQPLQRAVAE